MIPQSPQGTGKLLPLLTSLPKVLPPFLFIPPPTALQCHSPPLTPEALAPNSGVKRQLSAVSHSESQWDPGLPPAPDNQGGQPSRPPARQRGPLQQARPPVSPASAWSPYKPHSLLPRLQLRQFLTALPTSFLAILTCSPFNTQLTLGESFTSRVLKEARLHHLHISPSFTI